MCPRCHNTGSRVSDSRINKRGHIRRRRKCSCGYAFSTYEITEKDYQDQVSAQRAIAVMQRAVVNIEREITLLQDEQRAILSGLTQELPS